MGWLVAGGILLILGILPVGISAEYDSGGPRVWLLIWPLRLHLYPVKKHRSGAKKNDKPKKTAFEKKKTAKKGGNYSEFLPLFRNILDIILDLRQRLRVRRLEMKLILADADPCDLAVNYGKAWAALGNLLPRLEQLFVIKKRELEVECDFTADKTLIYVRIDITVTVGRLLYIAAFHGTRILKKYILIMNQRKGGVRS